MSVGDPIGKLYAKISGIAYQSPLIVEEKEVDTEKYKLKQLLRNKTILEEETINNDIELLKLKKEFTDWKAAVEKTLKQLAFGIGGGGSHKLMDNSDVVFEYIDKIQEDSILAFDVKAGKFKLKILEEITGMPDTDGTYCSFDSFDGGTY